MKTKLYKGTFNWHGEVHVVYTHAPNKTRALMNMVHKLEWKLPYDYWKIYGYFKFGENKYEIKEVKKKQC